MPPSLSVVIPAHNESHRLPGTLERIAAFLERRQEPYEILVVDDGSTDDTAERAARFTTRGVRVIRLTPNRGKGAACRVGVREAAGAWILLTDADLATPITELERLEQARTRAPLLFGSRALAASRITTRQPFYRQSMGKLFNLLLRMLGVRGLRDTQCGFKLLEAGVAKPVFEGLTVDGFAFDAELAWLAQRQGLAIEEVGVEWGHVEESKVRVLRDSLRMLRDVLGFRWRHRGAARAAGGRLGADGGRQ